jgi:hypothetical protein
MAAMPRAALGTKDAGAAPPAGELEPVAPALPKPESGALFVPDAVGFIVEDMAEEREAFPR